MAKHKTQQSLSNWTKEEWGTKSGKNSTQGSKATGLQHSTHQEGKEGWSAGGAEAAIAFFPRLRFQGLSDKKIMKPVSGNPDLSAVANMASAEA